MPKRLSKAAIDKRVMEVFQAIYGEHRRDNLKRDLRAIDRAEVRARLVRKALEGGQTHEG